MENRECKVCGSLRMHKVLDLGKMPSANGLVEKKDLENVKSYPLRYYWCEDCSFFQQIELIGRDELFGNFYAYQTGVSLPAVKHFRQLSVEIGKEMKIKRFAVVLASNDGTEIGLLRNFGGFNSVIGIEPAKNLAESANAEGFTTINRFFDRDLARQITSEYGKADLIVANNVFAHIPYPKEFMLGMGDLVKEDGTILIEVHWLKSLVDNLQIDTLYGEHYYVWSVKAMEKIAELCGLIISKVSFIEEHGGSIRVLLKKTGSKMAIRHLLLEEKESGLYNLDRMERLQGEANRNRDMLVRLVRELKNKNKKIAIWTVPAKIATRLNFCGLTSKEIDCAYDITKSKIGKYIPKANIPIKDERLIEKDRPDYLIVGAWNYMEFGKKKLRWYLDMGGKLINPLTCEVI